MAAGEHWINSSSNPGDAVDTLLFGVDGGNCSLCPSFLSEENQLFATQSCEHKSTTKNVNCKKKTVRDNILDSFQLRCCDYYFTIYRGAAVWLLGAKANAQFLKLLLEHMKQRIDTEARGRTSATTTVLLCVWTHIHHRRVGDEWWCCPYLISAGILFILTSTVNIDHKITVQQRTFSTKKQQDPIMEMMLVWCGGGGLAADYARPSKSVPSHQSQEWIDVLCQHHPTSPIT